MSTSSIKAWLVLLWFAPWLAACGASHVEMDANTNWLRQCAGSGDCSSDQVCACGVCTVACLSSDSCQRPGAPDARCVSVADAQCGGGAIETGAVCAKRCELASDCGGDLSCSAGACVLVGTEPRMSDADVRDADVPDAAADAAQDGSMAPVWSGAGCEPADPQRSRCGTDADCTPGELCHVDGTCIEPGRCDELGRTTLAYVGNAVDLALSAEHVYVLDYGSEDPLGNHRRDGAIVRAPIAGGGGAVLVDQLDRPARLALDEQRMLWSQGGFDDRELWSAERANGSDALVITRGGGGLHWTHDASHVYFAAPYGEGLLELFRVAKGTTGVEILTDEKWDQVSQLEVDSSYVYAVRNGGTRRIPLAGGGAVAAPAEGTSGGLSGELELGQERLFYAGLMGQDVVAADKADGDLTRLAVAGDEGYVFTLRPFREHVYYVLEIDQRVELRRASLIPGQDERLATMPRADIHVTGPRPLGVSDRGLFWTENQHVLRQVIPEYATDPQQGSAGAPCFGDLTCQQGLACVDTVCETAPSVPPSPCAGVQCADGYACEAGQCLHLWSGDGCDAATPLRPLCPSTGCARGLVCHVDGRCIEPGKCDRFGRATLAQLPAVRDLAVTADRVYALDYGSEDALGIHAQDGAIYSLPITGGLPDIVVDGIDRPQSLEVDQLGTLWSSGSWDETYLSRFDRTSGRAHPLVFGVGLRWVQDATYLYLATKNSDDSDSMGRLPKSSGAVESIEIGSQVSTSFAVDSTSIYISGGGGPTVLPLAGGPGTELLQLDGEIAVDRDAVFDSGENSACIVMMPKATGKRTVLVDLEHREPPLGHLFNVHPYREHVYYWAVTDESTQLRRVPMVPGAEEVLATVPRPELLGSAWLALDVSDQGMFWVQGHSIVRQVLEDYAAGLTTAQGAAGGPCFGDFSCDAGLACVDRACQ